VAAAALAWPCLLPAGPSGEAAFTLETTADLETGNGQEAPGPKEAEFAGNPMSSVFGWWPEDLIAAPIPGYSPEFGWKLGLMAGYFLDLAQDGSEAPPSLLGVFGMTSENGSNAYAIAGNLHLFGDRLRVVAAYGEIDFRYRFWGIGNDAGETGRSIDIRQQSPIGMLSARYEVLPDLYAGLGYLGGDSDIALRFDVPLPPGLDDPTLAVKMAALQVPVDYDTRDSEYFPREGWLASARGFFYRESIGSDFNADIYSLSVNRYLPMRDRDVFAARGYFKAADDSAPFFLLSSFGGKTDLRGYDNGRYRDRMMYALQGEYRWRYSDSWVFTGFAGVGEVANSFGDFGDNLLPAAGVGARFMLSQTHQFSLSFDVATGKNGTQFYFGLGEAF
jgi:hypothetical protein